MYWFGSYFPSVNSLWVLKLAPLQPIKLLATIASDFLDYLLSPFIAIYIRFIFVLDWHFITWRNTASNTVLLLCHSALLAPSQWCGCHQAPKFPWLCDSRALITNWVPHTAQSPINILNEQDFLLINNVMSAFRSALVSNVSIQHEPRV